jgi:alpha-glucoside transport system permease protein
VLGAGLRAVPYDRLRMARAAGVGPVRRLLAVLLQPIRPVLAVAALTLLVAASRVFDLVLVAVPGSAQQAADVVGLAWVRTGLPDDRRAALVVLLSVVLAGLAAAVSYLGATRRRTAVAEPAPAVPAEPRRRPVRRLGAAAVGLVVAVWAVPFLVLVATSLRGPAAAARSGWWSGGGWSLESYRFAFAGGELTAALAGSAVVATTATLVLLALAVPAAYAFAWGGLRRRWARPAAAACAALAVLPAQAYALPLGELVARAQVFGGLAVLAVVHAVVGLPFAVLLLRGAFATVPAGDVIGDRLDGGEMQAALAVVGARARSVVAVAVLEFVLVWNDLLIGLLLGAPGTRLVSLALLGGTRQFAVDAGPLTAAAVVATAVPLLLVLGAGRWLVRGLAAGVAR